jgi:hypothetical protein
MFVFIFRWQFSTDGYDVGFGIYRRTKDSRQKAGNMEEVLPSKRVNSHLILEDGPGRVKPKTLKLVFVASSLSTQH